MNGTDARTQPKDAGPLVDPTPSQLAAALEAYRAEAQPDLRDPETAHWWREEADQLIRVVLAAEDPVAAWREATGVPEGERCDDTEGVEFFAGIRRAARGGGH